MNRFFRFMQGRYGIDAFGFFLFISGFVINIVRIFMLNRIAYLLCTLLSTAFFVYALFRCLSTNINRRAEENRRYMQIKEKIIRFFRHTEVKSAERKTRRGDALHRYFKCPHCRQEVRVPKGRGKIRITCPKCQYKFIKKT